MIFTARVFQLIFTSAGRGLGVGLRFAGRTTVQIVQAIRHRRDAQVLARMDAKMLADIGLTPSDVRDAFAEPLWRDPTGILASRINERRRSRPRAMQPRAVARWVGPVGPYAPSPARSAH